jgi:hypothetical protein
MLNMDAQLHLQLRLWQQQPSKQVGLITINA